MKYTNGLTDKEGYKLISSNDLEAKYREEKLDLNVDTLTYKQLKYQKYIPDEFFKTNFDLMRTGKIYGSRIFKSKALCRYEQKDGNTLLGSDKPEGEYLKDSIGLRCKPYVKGLQEAIDDFTDTAPMFRKWRCNAYLDENGDIRVKYIQGQEGYKRSYKEGETAMDDCILKMSFYWKMEEGESYFDYFVSDTKHDDTWLPWGDCIRHDKSVASYFALPAYVSTLHKDEDGFQRLYSITNSLQQGNFSHDSQLPYYSQAYNEDESLLDDNTYSYEVGRGNGNETPGKNNTYRGRGRHYGTRSNITAYLALMQIIKYKTRNLQASSNNISFNIPSGFDDNGNPTGNTNSSINPWNGRTKYGNCTNQRASSIKFIRAIWWNDEAKDSDGNYTIKRKRNTVKPDLYVDIPESYFGEDYDGTAAFVPICPNITVNERQNTSILDEDGYPTVQIDNILNRMSLRVGVTYVITCDYCNNNTDTTVQYRKGITAYNPTNDYRYVKPNAKISKIEKIKVDLPEIPVHYDAFEVTKWNGTKMTVPEGDLVVPADTYYFYKVYFEGIDSIQSTNRDVRYSNDPNAIHPYLKGKVVINDTISFNGNVDIVPKLYDGTTILVNENKDIHSYLRTTNPSKNLIQYQYENYISSYNPYRLEGIEVQNGCWLTSSNTFSRTVLEKDSDNNITNCYTEIYVAKKGAKRHKIVSASGSYSGIPTDINTDKMESIENNYIKITSLLNVNKDGNFFTHNWGWIGDCKIYQDEEGNNILYPIMRADGMYYPGSGNNEGQNWGDEVWGSGYWTKFTHREILLIGNAYETSTQMGISVKNMRHPMNFYAWDFASRSW